MPWTLGARARTAVAMQPRCKNIQRIDGTALIHKRLHCWSHICISRGRPELQFFKGHFWVLPYACSAPGKCLQMWSVHPKITRMIQVRYSTKTWNLSMKPQLQRHVELWKFVKLTPRRVADLTKWNRKGNLLLSVGLPSRDNPGKQKPRIHVGCGEN